MQLSRCFVCCVVKILMRMLEYLWLWHNFIAMLLTLNSNKSNDHHRRAEHANDKFICKLNKRARIHEVH